ncbi:MAG: hypothetical protein R3A48_09420 [Polyangiales bacterium]
MTSPLARRALATPARSAAAIVGALAALPLVLGLRFQGRDHTLVQLGLACAHRDASRLVLDPALGGGSPLLQDPLGQVLYPITWLLRPFPAELAASLYVALHLGLAAGAAAWLAREMGGTRRAALLTGVAFALCGTAIDLVAHGPYLSAAAWLPLGWAGARSLLRDLDPRGAGALALSLGMLVLGGEPHAAVVLTLVACVELAGRLARARGNPRRALQATAALAGAGVAGALLGAAQVAATLGLRAAAARSAGVGLAEKWALDGLGLFALVVPASLTADARHGASLVSALRATPLSVDLWNASPYLGALTLLGAAVGAVFGVRRLASAVGGGALVLAAGSKLGVLTALSRAVPPLAMFRYPEKYLTIASLALLVAAVQAWTVAARSPRLRLALRRATIAVAATMCLGCSVIYSMRGAIDRAAARVAVPPLGLDELPALSTSLLSNASLALAVALLASLALGSRRYTRWLPALLVADLALFALRVAPLDAPVLELPSPREAVLPRGAMLCHGVGASARPPFVPGFPTGDRRGVAFNRVDLRPDVNQCSHVATPNLYLPSAQYASMRLAYTLLDPSTAGGVQVARALGCTHVLAPGAAHPSLRPMPTPRSLAPLFAIPDPLPAVSVARAPILVRRLRETLRALQSGGDAADAARWIDDPLRREPVGLPSGEGATRATVSWLDVTSGVVSIEGRGGAVAVVRRPWWPGWTATQGGRPLRVLRAAGVQLAVVIPDVAAGPVRLRYEVEHLRLGAGLSLAGAALTALLALALRRRRRS